MTIMPKVVEIHESEQSSEDESPISNDENEEVRNAAWADSIAKILKTNKPKRKKSLVLSKAKKLTDVKVKKKSSFEVATTDGEIKTEETEDIVEAPLPIKRRKTDLVSLCVKPNILDKDKERMLAKIATRGVVQLFNAVKTQQKDISQKLEEAGPLEVRKEKVMKSIDKRAFLDVLMGGKSGTENSLKLEGKEESTWSVLKDDFMMGAKLRDWDKEKEEEEEKQVEIESE